MLKRAFVSFKVFPLKFWVLVLATFIDNIGRTMIFPFFALYITQRFEVGMTEAGVLFGIFSISGLFGNLVGGGITDRLGRRKMVIFGLVFSAISSLSMGVVGNLLTFYGLAVFVGLFSSVAGPARMAMAADLLEEEQRVEGYGVLRVTANLSWILGPALGGWLAWSVSWEWLSGFHIGSYVSANPFLILFVFDSLASIITAVIVFLMLPETKPILLTEKTKPKLIETFSGYNQVIRDNQFISFILVAMMMLLVYQQMYNTLSVYLRDMHGITGEKYGLLLSLDAGIVVLCQFWVSKRVKKFEPFRMMAFGTAFYMVGFTMFGLVSAYWLFIVAILIITVGEMIVDPVGQALVAKFSPEDMRGRYMAVSNISWAIPASVGPWAAGLVMDNFNPNLVWYLAGGISLAAVFGFLVIERTTQPRFVEDGEAVLVESNF